MEQVNPLVTFDEFKKLDLRVAKVKEVLDHPRADKLLLLKVDVGGVEKQIVAGLKPWYPGQALVGKTIIIVNNLEPATLRGEQSQGMLLAAQDGERVMVLVPDGEAAAGSQVR